MNNFEKFIKPRVTLRKMYEDVLNYYGIDNQIDHAIQELDELKEALINFKSHKGNTEYINHLKEESADVANMLEQIDLHLKFDMLSKLDYMHFKMQRTMNRINHPNLNKE